VTLPDQQGTLSPAEARIARSMALAQDYALVAIADGRRMELTIVASSPADAIARFLDAFTSEPQRRLVITAKRIAP
jgi:hypothetical protein